MPATEYYYCTAPGCDVVYFPADPDAAVFSRHDLLVAVAAKESSEEAPICYCFGVNRRQIQEEVQATGQSSAAEKIKTEIQAGRCACEVKNPSGKCCLGDVTRVIQECARALRIQGRETTLFGRGPR